MINPSEIFVCLRRMLWGSSPSDFFQMLNMTEVPSRKRRIKSRSEVEFYWETSLNCSFGSRRSWRKYITTDLNVVVVQRKLWIEHIFLGVAGTVFVYISIIRARAHQANWQPQRNHFRELLSA